MKRLDSVRALSFIVVTISFAMSAACIAGEKTAVPNLRFICTPEPLQVSFDIVGGHYSGEVNCGNLFLQTDIPTAPLVSFRSASADKLYTLMMIDPDGNAHGAKKLLYPSDSITSMQSLAIARFEYVEWSGADSGFELSP